MIQLLGRDPRRSRLRATVAEIQTAMTRLAADKRSEPRLPTDLLTAWADLVDQLALGPEPELRQCPACHGMCMREATACGHCFASLTPAPRSDLATA